MRLHCRNGSCRRRVLHEIKYDGYRMHGGSTVVRDPHRARLEADISGDRPAVTALDARQAYLDGELCGLGPDGITSFGRIKPPPTPATPLFALDQQPRAQVVAVEMQQVEQKEHQPDR